jgi:cytochrome c-type biogenesis protein CcsB
MFESLYYAEPLFKITFYAYILTMLVYALSAWKKNELLNKIALGLFGVSFALCTALIVYRWIEAGRPPFKSFYESLVFSVWTISVVSLAAEIKLKVRLIGLLASISIFFIFIYALFKRDVEIIALPPALQTWLFIPHVISYFIAYGALFVAGLGGALHLIFPKGMAAHHTMGSNARIDFSDFAYQITKFGYLFLTVGLLLGAWWGQIAWSNYWGWDPKENWALITWLIFSAYLHFRNLSTFSSKKLSWVLIIGVVVIIFTYVGMSMLPTANDSLHIYSE